MKHGINFILEPKITKDNEFVNTIYKQMLLISTNLNSKIQQTKKQIIIYYFVQNLLK